MQKRWIILLSCCLAFVLTVGIAPPKAYACLCTHNKSVWQQMNDSTITIHGRVESVTKTKNGYKVTLYVLEQWKGPRLNDVTLLVEWVHSMCGLKFKVGKEYIVYGKPVGTEGVYRTDICSRTAEITIATIDSFVLGWKKWLTMIGLFLFLTLWYRNNQRLLYREYSILP